MNAVEGQLIAVGRQMNPNGGPPRGGRLQAVALRMVAVCKDLDSVWIWFYKDVALMDHNKIIKAAAKKTLTPLGLVQERKSRVWFDDHGWWAIVVEFQPSSWSRGSYLNVALSWMLYENAHWTFDIGGRKEGFESAEEQDFEAAMEKMAVKAAQSVHELREQFVTLDDMYAYYQKTIERHGGWPDYEAGILAGLRDDRTAAEEHFMHVLNSHNSTMWHRALKFRCQDLMRLLKEPTFFRDSVFGIVLRCRAARCLPDLPSEEMGFP